MEFTRTGMKTLRQDVNAELEAVGLKHGVLLTMGSGTFDPTGKVASFKLEVQAVGDNGEVATKERADWPRWQAYFGLQDVELDQKFQFKGSTYSVEGIASRSRTAPVVAKKLASGKRFKFSTLQVKAGRVEFERLNGLLAGAQALADAKPDPNGTPLQQEYQEAITDWQKAMDDAGQSIYAAFQANEVGELPPSE